MRALRGVVDIDDYIDRIAQYVAPPDPGAPSHSWTLGPLDLPYAIGYLDAVWRAELGQRLFVNLDAASVARLTQPVNTEPEFNAVLSALADVLAQVAAPNQSAPRQTGALEAERDALLTNVPPEPTERIRDAFATLIEIRHFARQHSAQRRKAQGH